MRDVLRAGLRSALRSGLDRAVRWQRGRSRAGAVQTPRAVPVPAPAAGSAARVELGFRDGSTAELEAGSEQAVALQALARTLTART